MKIKYLLMFTPIVIAVTAILLFFLLQNKNSTNTSSFLLNENLPKFETISLFNQDKKISNDLINDKQVIINFFASWCAPCKAEHHLLVRLKNTYPKLMIIGIDHKDTNADAIKFLEEANNPYNYVGIDKDGKIGMKFGVIGLPETFLTNEKNKIIYQHLGPLTKKIVKNEIEPLLK